MFQSRFSAGITRLALTAVLGAACAQAPASAPSATATTAQTPSSTASAGALTNEFVTSEGYWTLGKADAKVLFIDSSDFG